MKRDEIVKIKSVASLPAQSSSRIPKQELTTSVLQFLSATSSEAIIGIFFALLVFIYAVFGIVGLLPIGVAIGIALHAFWESQSQENGTGQRKDTSLDIVKRLLDLRNQNFHCGTGKPEINTTSGSFDYFQPETAAALRELVEAIIQHHVKSWYQPILPRSPSFILASQQALSRFILSISLHLSKKRSADIFLDFLTNSSSIIIVFLSELSVALSQSSGPPVEAVYSYLSTNPDSSLANALDEEHQTKKLKLATIDLLQNFLDKTIYDCELVRIFFSEVLSRLVLEKTLETCSKSEWINWWIVSFLEKGEPDISQMIDAGMNTVRQEGDFHEKIEGSVNSVPTETQTPIEEEQLQRFNKLDTSRISEISHMDAAEEVRRLSNLIAEEEAKKANSLLKSSDASFRVPIKFEEQTDKFINFKKIKKNGDKLSSADNYVCTPNSETLHTFEYKNHSKLDQSRWPSASLELPPSPPSLQNDTFKNFDQLNLDSISGKLKKSPPRVKKKRSLTLHNATIVINDDDLSTEKGKLRNKPNSDYLIQIEPASFNFSGWMIVRRYTDFEILHEILRRIAQISGVTWFTDQHPNLPNWKDNTKASLRGELERYLRDACWFQPLAESEGMKRFLKKDEEQLVSYQNNKNGFSAIAWPTPTALETVGKGVLDVIANAPKGVAGGGKAITGVLNNIGNLGQKKPSGRQIETLTRTASVGSSNLSQMSRASEESSRNSLLSQVQLNKIQHSEWESNQNPVEDHPQESHSSTSTRSSISTHQSLNTSHEDLDVVLSQKSLHNSGVQNLSEPLVLPPTPSEIPDHFRCQNVNGSITSHSHFNNSAFPVRANTNPAPSLPVQDSQASITKTNLKSRAAMHEKDQKMSSPLTESEAKVAVELIFAVISEMYTISSAWNIRRTLLTATKTYFLRPGNPSLSKIQSLIQESVIVANTSDTGVATHLRRLREKCFPSEEESSSCPTEMSTEDKERLRIKARNLLIKRGVPIALTGIMGQAATSEAMGRIFDCLQIEKFARGLIFGLLLQAIHAVVH